MATYKIRGSSHCVIYPYKTDTGKALQHWETYTTELEAIQRKAYIEYLQKQKDYAGLHKAVNEYKDRRARERAELDARHRLNEETFGTVVTENTDNLYKTYREFALCWLPIHARKKRLSPRTYDGYKTNLELHILPYFGDRIFSTITTADIDDWLDQLSQTPCSGSKSYHKAKNEIPTLSSSSIKKFYNILIAGFPYAKEWGYIKKIPHTRAPAEKQKKRNAWDSKKIFTVLNQIEDKLLHLAVHISFVCSMRVGEVGGIDVKSINFFNRGFWIHQELCRVTEESLETLPANEIIRVFPPELKNSKSRLILKEPKTEDSVRFQYLTTPLLKEIKERMAEIEENKQFFGSEYHDYGLLICKADGTPIDPRSFSKQFKECQRKIGIEEANLIDMQGLRKSGQMHKVRLSNNNYQLVAEAGGQSPEVLMSNYNEALEEEKKNLSMLVETNFYGNASGNEKPDSEPDITAIMKTLQNSPEVVQQLLQLLQPHTHTSQFMHS